MHSCRRKYVEFYISQKKKKINRLYKRSNTSIVTGCNEPQEAIASWQYLLVSHTRSHRVGSANRWNSDTGTRWSESVVKWSDDTVKRRTKNTGIQTMTREHKAGTRHRQTNTNHMKQRSDKDERTAVSINRVVMINCSWWCDDEQLERIRWCHTDTPLTHVHSYNNKNTRLGGNRENVYRDNHLPSGIHSVGFLKTLKC